MFKSDTIVILVRMYVYKICMLVDRFSINWSDLHDDINVRNSKLFGPPTVPTSIFFHILSQNLYFQISNGSQVISQLNAAFHKMYCSTVIMII